MRFKDFGHVNAGDVRMNRTLFAEEFLKGWGDSFRQIIPFHRSLKMRSCRNDLRLIDEMQADLIVRAWVGSMP